MTGKPRGSVEWNDGAPPVPVHSVIESVAGTGAQGGLSLDELREAQQETLARPLRPYGVLAKGFFAALNVFYGRGRTLRKFHAFEIGARGPYQAWEMASYAALADGTTATASTPRLMDHIHAARRQHDNEQWHALLIQEQLERQGESLGGLRHRLVPRLLALGHRRLSRTLHGLRPAWSYRFNADIEDHAEHEYMEFVAEHPEFERMPFVSAFAEEYRPLPTLADLFRQIAYDERVHRMESDRQVEEARSRS